MVSRWDVCYADIQFEDKNESKRRPVLVLNSNSVCILTAKITGHDERDIFDYAIQDWIPVGIDKPSVVRLSKKIKIPPKTQLVKIGKLSKQDIDGIKQKCKELSISLIENKQEKNKMKLLKEEKDEEMIKEQIIAHLNDMSGEDLVRLVNEINSTDGSLDSIDYQLFDEEFFSVYFTDPMEAARATYFGDIKNWNDNYIRFNAYGNLESENDYGVKEKILDYADEISDWIIERGTTDVYQDADAFQEILDSAEEDDESEEAIEESVSDDKTDEEFEKEWEKLGIPDNAEVMSVEDANNLIKKVVDMKW